MVTSPGPRPIGRDPAQRLAREELSKAIYHQRSIPQIIVDAIESFLQRIFQTADRATPGGWWTLIALIALAVIVIAAVLAKVGPIARSARRQSTALGLDDSRLTARQHRDLAEASAAAGDYSTAVLERLRAVATSLEERGVLSPAAGRTADELATLAATRFPGHRQELADAARLFDQIRYGDGTGTATGYGRLRDLDDALARDPALAGANG